MADFRQLFISAVRHADDASWLSGRLGLRNNDGSVRFSVPGRSGHVYVRRGAEGELGIIQARNEGCPLKVDLPVQIRQERGDWVCRVDGARLAQYWGSGAVGGPVAYHTHRTYSGLEYEVEALWLEPGRVSHSSGMIVAINGFFYNHSGDLKYFPDSTLDLTANKPGAAGQWRWVVVCVNPATNAAIAVNGTAQSTASPLATADIAAIDVTSYLPLGGVKVKQSDTSLGEISRYADAREWLNRGPRVLDELTDVAITTPVVDDFLRYDGALWVNTPFTERVQDVVGGLIVDSADLDVTYDDTGNLLSIVVKPDAIDFSQMQDVSTGIVLGRFSALTGNLEELSENLFVLASGANPLTAEWDIGEDMAILAERIEARDAEGLALQNDGGDGFLIDDSGNILAGTSGMTTPGGNLEVRRSGAPASVVLRAYRSSATGQAAFEGQAARGTEGAPATLNSGDWGFLLTAKGWDTAAFQPMARVVFAADGTQAVGSTPGRISFYTTPTGTVTPSERLRITSGGAMGLLAAAASPQGVFHAHDTVSGFNLITKGVTSGTAVTVIPNGTGDVIVRLDGFYICKPSSGASAAGVISAAVGGGLTPGTTLDMINTGTDICQLQCNADGSITLQRTAGTLTYTVSLLLFWQ